MEARAGGMRRLWRWRLRRVGGRGVLADGGTLWCDVALARGAARRRCTLVAERGPAARGGGTLALLWVRHRPAGWGITCRAASGSQPGGSRKKHTCKRLTRGHIPVASACLQPQMQPPNPRYHIIASLGAYTRHTELSTRPVLVTNLIPQTLTQVVIMGDLVCHSSITSWIPLAGSCATITAASAASAALRSRNASDVNSSVVFAARAASAARAADPTPRAFGGGCGR
eukprot:3932265-Prymnesium_polylepis.1